MTAGKSPMTPPTGPSSFRPSSFGSLAPLIADLKSTTVFAGLSEEELREVATCCCRERYYQGQTIFEDSDSGDDLYIILKGRVTIRLESIQPYYEMVVSSLGEGQVIGEMALLGQRPRSAAAVCSEPTEALRARGAELRALFEKNPRLGYLVISNLAEILCERLDRMNRRLLNLIRTNLY